MKKIVIFSQMEIATLAHEGEVVNEENGTEVSYMSEKHFADRCENNLKMEDQMVFENGEITKFTCTHQTQYRNPYDRIIYLATDNDVYKCDIFREWATGGLYEEVKIKSLGNSGKNPICFFFDNHLYYNGRRIVEPEK